MKKILLSCLMVGFLSITAKAQLTYGPEAGLNISNYNITIPGFIAPTTVWVPGVRIGGIVDYGINDNISLQPGLFYAINGISYSYNYLFFGNADISVHINSIQIPANVTYKFGDAAGNRFFLCAGPFLGINLGGSYKLSVKGGSFFGGQTFDSSSKITVGPDSADYIKRFDFGIGINAGYQFAKGYFIRAYYQMGFVNLAPMADAGYSTKSINFGVSVGYLFGGKPAKNEKNKTIKKKK